MKKTTKVLWVIGAALLLLAPTYVTVTDVMLQARAWTFSALQTFGAGLTVSSGDATLTTGNVVLSGAGATVDGVDLDDVKLAASSFGSTSASTVTTTSSAVALPAGGGQIIYIVASAPSTNPDRIFISSASPATTSDTALDPGDSVTLDLLGGTQIYAIALSGTQTIDVTIGYQ